MSKLTMKDMRDIEAAYHRGQKCAMERLGDGAILLRKSATPQEHDKIHEELSKWLQRRNFNLRAPGVKDNLFRLSDYISGRLPVPPREVLMFLHAYIFALEGLSTRIENDRERERTHRYKPVRPKPPRPVRTGPLDRRERK